MPKFIEMSASMEINLEELIRKEIAKRAEVKTPPGEIKNKEEKNDDKQ